MKKLQHFGAVGTVTGSCHLLVGDEGSGVLIDCGMFQGPKEVMDMNLEYPHFNGGDIDHVILTHAHLDHCGRLPLLAKMGFTGDVYMTQATRDLIAIVLYDSAKIAASDPDKEPLYTDYEVEQILSSVKVVEYNKPFSVAEYSVVMRDAGHLLGSATVEMTDMKTDNDIKKIVFSGDLGNTPDPLLRSLESVPNAGVVVIETTYGDRKHPKEDQYALLADEIKAVHSLGSTLLIPAFSLERTQMLLYMIKVLKRQGKIPNNIPVFLDSPMGIAATRVYRKYVHHYNDTVQNEFDEGDAFSFPALTLTRSHKQSMRIRNTRGAKIVIAGSGMMTGGRVVGHAGKLLPHKKNRLLFVGYQGEETLGRDIKEGAREVEIDGIVTPIHATVSEINNMSAHADQTGLINWLGDIKGVKKVVLVHGEDGGPRETFAKLVKKDLNIDEVYTPHMDEEIRLDI